MSTLETPLQATPDNIYDADPFFELSLDLLIVAGFDGYFKRINPAVSKLLGYSNEELLAKPIDEFVYIADRHTTEKFRDDLRNKIPLLNFENRYVTKCGEIVWLSWTSIPVDEKSLVYAIAKNVTHKKKVEEERNSLYANLTKINAELKQLTYKASHDLRSPVNNLLSVFSLLDTSKIQDEETLELIQVLQSTTEGLKVALNDYVETVTQKDGLSVQVEELSLSKSLNVVLRSINSLIKDCKVSFEIDFSKAQKVRFNKAYLESVFLNLITNSIKYRRAAVPLIVKIHSSKQEGQTQLVFSDNGMGFDMAKVKDRIFGLHQKFHHHIDSKGIGLYLIYNHITSLGGKIAVESEINKGATFLMSFID